jgi:hypothetical protein
MDEGKLHLEILRVAHDIYERSGRIEGHALDNWLEAERIVKTLRKIAGCGWQKAHFCQCPEARWRRGGGIFEVDD